MDIEHIVMLTRSRVAELAGLSMRQVDYWERTGLLRPSVEQSVTGVRRVRLYGFSDAMTAMVLSALRGSISLQHIRQIIGHLSKLQFAVTEVRFAIAGKRVHFQLPDGTWGDFTDPGQIEFHEVLDLVPLRARVLRAGERNEADRGEIEKRRGVHGSKPVMKGTRVPVSAIQAYLQRETPVAEILEAYPSLSEADVERVRSLATA